MKDILEPFRKWSLILQGKQKNGCLFDIFPAIDKLLLHLKNSIAWFTDTPYQHLRISIRNAWNILNKYYTLANLSPAYFTLIALHPEMKMDYFLSEWSSWPDWIQMAQKSVENYWLNNWKT